MITGINSEDRLVQQTFVDHLRDRLGWETVYAHNAETFGAQGTLGRASEREVVLVRDPRAALVRSTAATAANAVPGSLYALAAHIATDLADAGLERLPAPVQAAAAAIDAGLSTDD